MKKYAKLEVLKERFEEEKCSEENLMRFVTVFRRALPTAKLAKFIAAKFIFFFARQNVSTFCRKIGSLFNCLGIELKWYYFHCRLKLNPMTEEKKNEHSTRKIIPRKSYRMYDIFKPFASGRNEN